MPIVDDLFLAPRSTTAPFAFNHEVVEVFDDMVRRSVPLYSEVLRLTARYVNLFYYPGTEVYDLGCSTGNFISVLLSERTNVSSIEGIDNSEPMIDQARRKLSTIKSRTSLRLTTGSIVGRSFPNASAVVVNYTLQFIPPRDRLGVLVEIRKGVRNGGILILSEKVKADCSEIAKTFVSTYHDFKQDQGYSEIEIAQKAKALEGVLVPMTAAENMRLLEQAGFRHRECFLRWNNFASFLAVAS